MEKKLKYASAEMEVVYLESSDVIATSTLGGSDESKPPVDNDAWTTPGKKWS